MNKAVLQKIRNEYAKEVGWKNWREMAENVNIVSKDVGEIAERYAEACNMQEIGGIICRTKIDAIRILSNSFTANEPFKNVFTDYIEIIVTEELETVKIKLSKLEAIREKIATRIMRTLFDATWWEHQPINEMNKQSKALRLDKEKK